MNIDSIYKTSWGCYIDLERLNAVHLVEFSDPPNCAELRLYFSMTTDPIKHWVNNSNGPKHEKEIVEKWKEHKGIINRTIIKCEACGVNLREWLDNET